MTGVLLFAVILLVVLAAVLREPSLLIPGYILLGAWLIGRWWSQHVLASLRFGRNFIHKAFLNDKVTVDVTVTNTSRLPVPWLRLHDSLQVELGPPAFDYAISLRPKETRHFKYVIQAGRRGVYPIGPLSLVSGDILGLNDMRKVQGDVDWLMVYPRVVPLPPAQLPSRTMLGALRHHQPIFEDPSRLRGKRDYSYGDSFRNVDWKATASSGRMQVKQFEPSVSLDVMLALNLNRGEYDPTAWIDGTELAIVVAASLGNWLIEHKQTVGLMTNGVIGSPMGKVVPRLNTTSNTQTTAAQSIQILQPAAPSTRIPARKGRAHFIELLELLAQVKADETPALAELLEQRRPHLAWGTTLLVVTGRVSEVLLNQLMLAQRHGISPVVVACGHGTHFDSLRQSCAALGIPAYHVLYERDIRRLVL